MGGHQTKQSVEATTDVTSNAVFDSIQDCASYMTGDQTISVSGAGNVLSGASQSISMSIDTNCLKQATQQASFMTDIANSIQQSLDSSQVAMTQWADPSGDDVSTKVNQNITSNVSTTDIQNCAASLSGKQLISVSGTQNVATDLVQNMAMTQITSCMMNSDQSAKAVSDVTNTTNQHSSYTSTNPLSFISDAISSVANAIGGSFTAIAAIVGFIVLVIVAVVIGVFHHSSEAGGSGAGSGIQLQALLKEAAALGAV